MNFALYLFNLRHSLFKWMWIAGPLLHKCPATIVNKCFIGWVLNSFYTQVAKHLNLISLSFLRLAVSKGEQRVMILLTNVAGHLVIMQITVGHEQRVKFPTKGHNVNQQTGTKINSFSLINVTTGYINNSSNYQITCKYSKTLATLT